ncbi:MAG: tetratricopeptide repeat protein [Deltaproteobacteria bacterium]|nr:tetratricopeptide repeat protein [Deltaproteobacteria bacterium]
MEWNIDFEENLNEDQRRWTKQTLRAQLFSEEGRYGEAAQELWETLTEARHAKDRRWECITLAHQGSVYRNIRNGICQKLLEEALALSEEIDFTPGKLIALTELGETACLWGKLDKADAMLERALSLVEPGRERDRRAVLLRLAMAREARGEIEKAKSLVDEALLIDRGLGIPDKEDREHRERLNHASESVQERFAS